MGKPRPGSVRVKQRAREEQELGESVVSLAGHLAQRTEEKSELGSIPVLRHQSHRGSQTLPISAPLSLPGTCCSGAWQRAGHPELEAEVRM